MYWETNEETEAETGVNENNKKNDTKPRSVGRGHKHLGVCCLQVLFFFRRSGCRHVTGREIRTAVWPPAGGARGGNVRLMQDNRAGQTTQWWKEKFLDASCICDAPCSAALRWLVWSQQVEFVIMQPPTSSELEVSARWRLLRSIQTTTRNWFSCLVW